MTAFSKAILADLIIGALTASRVQVIDPGDSANRVFIDPDLWSANKPLILLEYRDLAGGQQAIAGAQILAGEDATFGNFLFLKSPEELTKGYMALRLTPAKAYLIGSKVGQAYALDIGDSVLGAVDVSILSTGDLTMGTGQFTMDSGDILLDGSNDRIMAVGMRPTEALSVTNDTVASATYVHGTNGVGFSFTAPPSGVVRVDCYGHVLIRPSIGARRVIYATYELREGSTVGSGTVVSAANDEWAIQTESLLSTFRARTSGTFHKHETGLTAGNAYNVRTMHRIDDTTSIAEAIDAGRRLTVTPCM